jgi:hypothetical protein
MGFRLGEKLTELMKAIAGAPPLELTFVQSIPAPGILGIGEAVEPDSCYIELYLESLRPSRARAWHTRFHGVVYSFVTMSRTGEEDATLAAISRPDRLANLDPDAASRVITVSKRMMGATPFRGNSISLQLGLFSVKAGDVLTPVLEYVTEVSAAAGISFVGAVKPFLPLISKGMDLLTGQKSDFMLEVGHDGAFTLDTGQVDAIIACPKNSIDTAKLTLDQDRKLLLNGKPLDAYGYAVFSLRRTMRNPSFGEIPELKKAYADFTAACKANEKAKAEETLDTFRRTAILSPDLIRSDAERLIELAKKDFEYLFGAVQKIGLRASRKLGELSEIGLYPPEDDK